MTKSEIKTLLIQEIEMADKQIQKFTQDFATNQGHALDWSFSTFEAVARKVVCEDYLHAIEITELSNVIHYLRNEVLNGARFPHHSSSPTANLWSECLLTARASLYNIIQNGI